MANRNAAKTVETTTIGAPPVTDGKGKTVPAANDYPTINGVVMDPKGTVRAWCVVPCDTDEPGYRDVPFKVERLTLVGFSRKEEQLTFALDTEDGSRDLYDYAIGDENDMLQQDKDAAVEVCKVKSRELALEFARDAYHKAGLVANALAKEEMRAVDTWIESSQKERVQMLGALGANSFKALGGTAGNADAARDAFLKIRREVFKSREDEVTKGRVEAIRLRKALVEKWGDDVKKSNDEIEAERVALAKAQREEERAARNAEKLANKDPKKMLSAMKKLGLTKDQLLKMFAELA
jgi:hypothetical protein